MEPEAMLIFEDRRFEPLLVAIDLLKNNLFTEGSAKVEKTEFRFIKSLSWDSKKKR